MIWIALLAQGLGCGIVAAIAAEARDRSQGGWFLAGVLFGPLGLAAALAVRNLRLERLIAEGLAQRAPQSGPQPRIAGTYNGTPISITETGFAVDGRAFNTITEAQIHLETAARAAQQDGTYRGKRIVPTKDGFMVLGQIFPYEVDAKRHVDRVLDEGG